VRYPQPEKVKPGRQVGEGRTLNPLVLAQISGEYKKKAPDSRTRKKREIDRLAKNGGTVRWGSRHDLGYGGPSEGTRSRIKGLFAHTTPRAEAWSELRRRQDGRTDSLYPSRRDGKGSHADCTQMVIKGREGGPMKVSPTTEENRRGI